MTDRLPSIIGNASKIVLVFRLQAVETVAFRVSEWQRKEAVSESARETLRTVFRRIKHALNHLPDFSYIDNTGRFLVTAEITHDQLVLCRT